MYPKQIELDDSNFEDCSKNPYPGRIEEETNLNNEYNDSCNEQPWPSIKTEKEEIKDNCLLENLENKNTSGGTDEIKSQKEKDSLNSKRNENEQYFNFISCKNLQQELNCDSNNMPLINVTQSTEEKISNKFSKNNFDYNSIKVSKENEKNKTELTKFKPIFKTENDNKNDFSILIFLVFAFKDISKKKGSIPKYLKLLGVKGKHNQNTIDNYIKCIFNKCKDSLHSSITILFEKYGFFPNELTIESQIKGGYPAYRKFSKKTLIEIYCFSFPKNVGEEIKKNRKKHGFINQYNLLRIKQAINLEKRNKEEKIKTLDILFNKTIFYSVLEAFLDDKTFIISDKTKIDLEKFITYGFCLNYKSPQEKEKIKHDLKSKLNQE